ncbi:LamG domain-containing protein [Candidatus Poribacteria bacterium]|jgi:hypothetical protein|nr:LamG domain-containing protein [Candidatus Poribacteria bacterium]MBT5709853.1 LamG domain-containing protein [Candidatus Poribacteria bacterium]MBT7101034.1 LamG domain-containing protein [Candidatus Poribacteria bacterium]MBT7807524.1 LamG domain-containing protein [Candidatus Poribacteria bacterium]
MMKRMIHGMTGVMLMALIAVSAYAKIDPGTMAGIWLFDDRSGDVATDSSGNGNDGVLTGGADWTDGASVLFGSALELDGSGYVSVPDSASLDMEAEVTLTCRVRTDVTMVDMWGDRQVVLGKHYEEYELGIYMSGQLHTYTSDLAADYDEGIMASIGGKQPDGDDDWVEEKWYNITWTLDGTHEMAYVDGVLLGEYDKAHDGTMPGPNTFEIGQRVGGGLPVTGAIDDVGVFSVALDEEDIIDIYERGLAASVGIAPVDPAGKLAATWGDLKSR